MAFRVGISLSAGYVRVVAVRAGRVVAATEAEIGAGERIEDAVAEALASVPLPRFPRPRARVSLGPSLSQVRRLTGLPPIDDRRLVAQLVREGESKFFLRGGALLATGVRIEQPGTVWAAVLDEGAARAVELGCRAAGVAVDALVPAAVALAYGLQDGTHVWSDGATAAEVEVRGRALVAARRVAPPAVPVAPLPVPALATLDEHGWRFADAYGAAVIPGTEPLTHRSGAAGRRRDDVPTWRIALAATAATVAIGVTALAPARQAREAEAVAVARLERLRENRRAAAVAEGEYREVSAALAEISAFDARRVSPTLLLARLARALPEGSALVTLRVDSAGGSVVALGPRASAVLSPLSRVPGIEGLEIRGPVTRELAAGRQVERVTVGFRFTGAEKPR